MLESKYDEMTSALSKSGSAIIKELNPTKADLLHMAVGVAGEAGELLDAVKKATIYNKPIDHENTIEELGDLEFYMSRIRQIIGVTRDEVLEHNYKKLSKRYALGKYSNEQAQDRADKEDAELNAIADKRMASQKRISVNIEDL
ncbi:MAG: nucleoside triphosphate pyrophosphohydrolase family protein [Acinetobacter sp.]